MREGDEDKMDVDNSVPATEAAPVPPTVNGITGAVTSGVNNDTTTPIDRRWRGG